MNNPGQTSNTLFPTFRAAPRGLLRGVVWLWRKTWRVTVTLLALLIGAHLILTIVAGYRLERELKRLRAQGLPLTLAELAPPPVPDSENAAPLYQKAFGGLQDPEDSEAIHLFLCAERGAPRTEETPTWAEVETILARHEADLRLIERASECRAARFRVNWNAQFGLEIRHIAGIRDAVRYLAARAMLHARRGRAREAMNDLAAAIRMGNHLAPEPAFASQVTRADCVAGVFDTLPRVLSAAAPSADETRPLAEALSRTDLTQPWERAMQGELTFSLRFFDALRQAESGEAFLSRELGWNSRGGTTALVQIRAALLGLALRQMWPLTRVAWRPFLALDEVHFLRRWEQQIRWCRLPYRQSKADLEALSREVTAEAPWYAVVTRNWFPVFSQATAARDRGAACVGLMQAALALRAYQIEHGAYPASLAILRAAGRTLPDDPFSGKPLVYRRRGKGYLIYSIGADLKDDRGISRYQAMKRHGPGPGAGQVTYDISLRMTR